MKGVDFMKKEWSRPSLEVLHVNMTMAFGILDPPNTPIDPIDQPGGPMPTDPFGS
jgi:hypothetical protein